MSILNIFTVAFFGHRVMLNPLLIEERLEEYIGNLIKEKEYVDFLVGGSGEFDQSAASVVRRVRKNVWDGNSSLVLILPYMTADYRNNEDNYEQYYDDIEISFKAEMAHPKAAMQIRNREMVDRADLILCCIEHEDGGAAKAVQYARKQNKKIINLAEDEY